MAGCRAAVVEERDLIPPLVALVTEGGESFSFPLFFGGKNMSKVEWKQVPPLASVPGDFLMLGISQAAAAVLPLSSLPVLACWQGDGESSGQEVFLSPPDLTRFMLFRVAPSTRYLYVYFPLDSVYAGYYRITPSLVITYSSYALLAEVDGTKVIGHLNDSGVFFVWLGAPASSSRSLSSSVFALEEFGKGGVSVDLLGLSSEIDLLRRYLKGEKVEI